MKRLVLLLWLALVIPARAEEPVTPLPGTADTFRQLANILDALQKHYIAPDQVRLNEHATLAFREFVRSLDPEADLLTPEQFAATKQPAPLPVASPIQATNLAPGIAYCRLAEIMTAGVRELRGQLLPGRRSNRLILDLRDNAGGSFDAALQYARLFLPAESRIVALDFARPEQRVGFVSDVTPKFSPPVALLVNGGTSAEAEILAAALRDNGRAVLCGSRTAGRGLHYEIVALADGFGLKIPVSRYLPPSKRSFHGDGLTPDEIIDTSTVQKTDLALARALEILKR